MAKKRETITVEVMIKANFWKKIIWPPNRKTPLPKVVNAPLKMLTPIAPTASEVRSVRSGDFLWT